MELNSSTVGLVEVGGSHDECLLSQLHALKGAGKRIVFVCTPEIKDRNPIFEHYVDEYFITRFTGSKRKDFVMMRQAYKFLKNQKVEKVILNTAQGSHIRNLCWMARLNKMEFIGVLHTTRKLQGSFTQKSISKKVKKYLFLSDFLLNKVTAPLGIKLDYFYPLRFPSSSESTKREGKTLNVTIIGGVENRRKDLDGFVKMISDLNKDVHFTFLGKSKLQSDEVKEFIQNIDEIGANERVTLFDTFVAQEAFDKQLKQTDVILPLIHPNTPSADQYFKNQIAGAMSVAFSYKIPMLLHEDYQHIEEMQKASIYYRQEEFASKFPTLEELNRVSQAMQNTQKYNQEYQEERYLSFLFK